MPVLADDDNASEHPYTVIWDRNIFHLNPPPPPVKAEDQVKPDLPVIKITGIIKVGDKVRALFASQPKGGKETVTYFNLAEGERQGILEVVKIDPENESVDIINSGTPATLTVKNDKLAKNEGPPPAQPGQPGQPGAPGIPNPAGGPPGFPQMPTGMQPRRIPAPAMMAQPGGQPAANSPFAYPMRTRRTNLSAPPAQ